MRGPGGECIRQPTLADAREYLTFVVRGYAILLAVIWLLVAGLLAAGYLVGPPSAADAPTQQLDVDGPPGDVAADALAQLHTRDHTAEKRIRHESGLSPKRASEDAVLPQGPNAVPADRGTRISGGVLLRHETNYTTQRVRSTYYPDVMWEGYSTADARRVETHVTPLAAWKRYAPGGSWHRIGQLTVQRSEAVDPYSGDAPPYDSRTSFAGGPEAVRESQAVVRHENETALVVEITDGPAIEVFRDGIAKDLSAADVDDEELVVVVATEPSPRLAEIRYRATGPRTLVEETVVVTDVDSTDVDHPNRTPPTDATDAVDRTIQGVERIVGWVW